MKKITLSLLMLSMVVANTTTVNAQVDVTPPRFVFANQEVGPFVYDGVPTAAFQSNAAAKFEAAKSDKGGYAFLMGWGEFFAKNGVDQGNTSYMREMSNIVDLGGTVGKVLCFKGHNCTDDVFPYGIKPTTPLQGELAWPAIALYLGSKLNGADYDKKKYTARLSVTWRLCLEPDLYSDEAYAFSIRINDYSINTKPFLKLGDELKAVSAETEDADVWCKQEDDFEFNGDAEQVPLLLKFAFQKYAESSALLIKEIKVTINPIGDPITLEQITLTMNPASSIKNQTASAYDYSVDDNGVTVNNLSGERITVYNTLGAIITSFTATQSSENIQLIGNGIFVLKIADKTFKIIK